MNHRNDTTAGFEFLGGHEALDFVNTAGGSSKARDNDRLTGYAALLGWSRQAGLLTEEDHAELYRQAALSPEEAGARIRAARSYREALHTCLMAEQTGQIWPGDADQQVRSTIDAMMHKANLVRTANGFAWQADRAACGLDLPLARVVLSTEALLRSADMNYIRNCDRCSWLFIDKGRGRPRRWCSMATCGSRAKSARYYRRNKKRA